MEALVVVFAVLGFLLVVLLPWLLGVVTIIDDMKTARWL